MLLRIWDIILLLRLQAYGTNVNQCVPIRNINGFSVTPNATYTEMIEHWGHAQLYCMLPTWLLCCKCWFMVSWKSEIALWKNWKLYIVNIGDSEGVHGCRSPLGLDIYSVISFWFTVYRLIQATINGECALAGGPSTHHHAEVTFSLHPAHPSHVVSRLAHYTPSLRRC